MILISAWLARLTRYCFDCAGWQSTLTDLLGAEMIVLRLASGKASRTRSHPDKLAQVWRFEVNSAAFHLVRAEVSPSL